LYIEKVIVKAAFVRSFRGEIFQSLPRARPGLARWKVPVNIGDAEGAETETRRSDARNGSMSDPVGVGPVEHQPGGRMGLLEKVCAAAALYLIEQVDSVFPRWNFVRL
jgi:hypothetical protein